MRKILMFFTAVLCACPLFAYKFTGLSWAASQPVMETAGINYLPWNAGELEKKYGIDVHIFRYPAGSKIDSLRMATIYYNTLTRTPDDKIILIWVKKKQNDGVIIASEAVKKMVPQEQIEMLQTEVLRPFANAWYIGEQRVYSKILGTIIYILDKSNSVQGGIAGQTDRYIKYDDPLYRVSLVQPFYDIIKLFYFEPISFCMYFPFIMYMLFVRLLGMNFNKGIFIFFNILWVFVTGFMFVLILHRVKIIFPEYVKLISFILGISFPIYVFLFAMYWNDIEVAAYEYLHKITGGFGSSTPFGEAK